MKTANPVMTKVRSVCDSVAASWDVIMSCPLTLARAR
jgi:hypothetical protein